MRDGPAQAPLSRSPTPPTCARVGTLCTGGFLEVNGQKTIFFFLAAIL
jgi:hypothetical protein